MTKGMISVMIDMIMSLQSKDLKTFFAIDKISFASFSLSNIELQLEFGSVSKRSTLLGNLF